MCVRNLIISSFLPLEVSFNYGLQFHKKLIKYVKFFAPQIEIFKTFQVSFSQFSLTIYLF